MFPSTELICLLFQTLISNIIHFAYNLLRTFCVERFGLGTCCSNNKLLISLPGNSSSKLMVTNGESHLKNHK